jgi:hypothetical protein
VAVPIAAAVAYVAFHEAFASVWCFLAAVLSLYLAFVLHRLPENPEPAAAAGDSNPVAASTPPTR